MFCAGFASMPISFSNSPLYQPFSRRMEAAREPGENWARSPAQSGTAGERPYLSVYDKRSASTFQPNNGVVWTLVYNPLAQGHFAFHAVIAGLEHPFVEELHGSSQLSCHVFRAQHYL